MNHHFIIDEKLITADQDAHILYNADFSLGELDTISELPEISAVFAICGRINGKAANCRVVRSTQNLRKSIRDLYTDVEQDQCILDYMRSIKTKIILFREVPAEKYKEAKDDLVEEWTKLLKPVCNEELNKVY